MRETLAQQTARRLERGASDPEFLRQMAFCAAWNAHIAELRQAPENCGWPGCPKHGRHVLG